MSKRVIFYAITRNQWTSNNGWGILAVTKHAKGQLWGSYFGKSAMPTHCREEDMKAKFDTVEEAQGKIDLIKLEYEKYSPFIAELENMKTKIQRMRASACEKIING